MLLRFGVENHRSIRDRQELSFVASRLSDEPSHRFPVASLGEDALPVIGVYGANASGKSNVLDALRFFRSQVLDSHVARRPGEPMGRAPFKLSAASREAPSRFDVDFLLDGVRYHYGFAIDHEKVLEEWLYRWPKGRRQVWFHREFVSGNLFRFGPSLGGQNQTIAALTRDNSLFLSAAAQQNHEKLGEVYRWFQRNINHFIRSSILDGVGYWERLEDPRSRERVANLLRGADTGVVALHLRPWSEIVEAASASVREGLARYGAIARGFNNDRELHKLSLGHQGEDGSVAYFEYDEESLGTRTYTAILVHALQVLDSGGVFVVDELSASLHTLLAQAVVGLFTSPETNPRGAQLLFTTHDTNVLSCLRRDEIWFTEKDRGGATTLYPLTDIQTRQRDDIEKGYLQGRYGAIPVLGDFAKALDRGEE